MKFDIRLVPSPLWGKNCRSAFTATQWNTIRHKVYTEKGKKCAICEKKNTLLHCHEVFEYTEHADGLTGTQTLVGLMPVCVECHEVLHIGRTMTLSKVKGSAAISRLMARNGIRSKHIKSFLDDLMKAHQRRCKLRWISDLSFAKKYL